jgi:DNA-binding transcriptional MerR regulator
MYTVKQLSTLAGLTPRALRHYDQIGLLKPESYGENGYRYYSEGSVLRLQQILFYRELGLPLEEIRMIMADQDFDVLAALEDHRQKLQIRIKRLEQLTITVDKTIDHLIGEHKMSPKGLFEGFSEEQQEEYARQAEQIYDRETVRASNRKWKGYLPEKKQAILDEGRQIYQEMVAAMPKGADSPEVQQLVDRWRKHMEYFWTPNQEQLLGLAAMYGSSPDFKANFDAMHPELADFMREAVSFYVEKRKSNS